MFAIAQRCCIGLAEQFGRRNRNYKQDRIALILMAVGAGSPGHAATTPPTTPVVVDAGAYTTSVTDLSASWTTIDTQNSPFLTCTVQVRQDSVTGTVIASRDVTCATTTAATVSGLSLQQAKKYFIGVRACTPDQTCSTFGFTDGITVDATAPTPPKVTDDGTTTTSPSTLHVRITPSSDPESGITGYDYQVRRDSAAGPVMVDFTRIGLLAQVTIANLTLEVGKTYFVNLRAQNGAGTYSPIASTDGIQAIADTAPPQITSVSVINITLTTAVVTITTDKATTAQVAFGASTSYGQTATDAVLKTSHTITLTGLVGMTAYHARVTVTDANGKTAQSTDQVFTTPRPGPSVITLNGYQLLAQRRLQDGTLGAVERLVLKGSTYCPASRDTATSPTDPNNTAVRRNEFQKWLATDVPLLAAMGVNVVRLCIDPGIDATLGPIGLQLLDELYKRNIYAIITTDDAINNTTRIQQVVPYYRNHPDVLMWSVGNEIPISLYYGAASSVLDSAVRTNNAAMLIKSLDAGHPVVASWGDPDIASADKNLAATKNYVNTICPLVDVWSINVYRGPSFGTLFAQWASITTKPMFVSEGGLDAYDERINAVNESLQASWDVGLWNEILRNVSAKDATKPALGGTMTSLNDEWWKIPPPGVQHTGGWRSTVFPDQVFDETFAGVVTIDRVPRAAYYELKRIFDPAYVPASRSILFTAASRGALAAQFAGQYGYCEFLQDQIPFYSRTGGGGGGRGICVAAVSLPTGAIINPGRTFDTWLTSATGADMNALVDYVNSMPNNTLLLFSVGDDPGLTSTSGVRLPYPWVDRAIQMFQQLGSKAITNYAFRHSFALAAVKGEGVARAEQEGAGIEALANATIFLP